MWMLSMIRDYFQIMEPLPTPLSIVLFSVLSGIIFVYLLRLKGFTRRDSLPVLGHWQRDDLREVLKQQHLEVYRIVRRAVQVLRLTSS